MAVKSEGHIVAVVRLAVTAETFADVAHVAVTVLQQRAVTLAGFIAGAVLVDEEKAHILVQTEWASRESWAKAEWDHILEDAVAHLYEETASYDLHFYFPLAEVRR